MAVDRFQIHGYLRFLLVIRMLAPLAFLGILIGMSADLGIKLEGEILAILAALGLWFLWEAFKLGKWFNFTVEVSDEEIKVGNSTLKWEEIESATAQTALHFSTFIALRTANGMEYEIPGAINQSSFILTKVEKHVPNLVKKG